MTINSNLKAMQTPTEPESGEVAYGLHVARTLVPNRLTEVPVRVMNVSDHSVTWEK